MATCRHGVQALSRLPLVWCVHSHSVSTLHGLGQHQTNVDQKEVLNCNESQNKGRVTKRKESTPLPLPLQPNP